MIDTQIETDKREYFRNNIHHSQVIEFFRDVYIKNPNPEMVYIQIYDMFEMPIDDVSSQTYWGALDQMVEFYAELEEEYNKRIIEEKIYDDSKDEELSEIEG